MPVLMTNEHRFISDFVAKVMDVKLNANRGSWHNVDAPAAGLMWIAGHV